MNSPPADDEYDQMLLADDRFAGRVQQHRERRLSESYPHLPFEAAARLLEIDGQLADGNPLTGAVDHEALYRERGRILARHEPEHAAMVEQVGSVALSEEAPAAGPPRRRANLPPSAPNPEPSDEEIDAALLALGHPRSETIRADLGRRHEQEAIELAEADNHPFTPSEIGLAIGVRAKFGEQELSARERMACAEADRQRADEQYRAELSEAQRRAADNARELAEIQRKVQPKRRECPAGVVLPNSNS